jgi:hypothetical protein
VEGGGELEPVDELADVAGSPAVSELVAWLALDASYDGSEAEVASELAVAGDCAVSRLVSVV